MGTLVSGLTFFASLMLVLGSIITVWIFARSSATRRKLKPFLFGSGLFLIVSTFLIIDISRIVNYPVWLYALIAVGYVLVSMSVVRRKYEYLILLTAALPLLLHLDSVWFLLAPLPTLAVAYLVNRNYDLVWLPEDVEEKMAVKRHHKSWALLFVTFGLISVVNIYQRGGYTIVSAELLNYFGLVLKMFATGMLFSLIYRSLAVLKKDRVVLGLILSFVTIVSLITFALGSLLNTYYETELTSTVRSNAEMYKIVAETKYPEDELAKMLENKDPRLNDLADSILAQSGIHGTFFLGDERVAASESITGKGRFIGTKTGDTQAISKVLGEGQPYQGRLEKAGVVIMGGYEPIMKKDGTIIGMVAVSKSLESINTLQETIFRRMILGSILAVIIVFFATPLRTAAGTVAKIWRR